MAETSAPDAGEAGSAAYARWLAAQPQSDDHYLFTDARVRFRAREADLIVAAPGVRAIAFQSGSALVAPTLATPFPVPGVPLARVGAFLGALDGERSLALAAEHAALGAAERTALLDAGFGLVLFAPIAVASLERALPCAELMRFPGSPYEVVREYWENMVAVRNEAAELEAVVDSPEHALAELRRLHELALLGAKGDSFYRPASPIAAKGITPGELFHTVPRTQEASDGTRFIEGPRVNATFLGGPNYLAVLAARSGDPGAGEPARAHRDERGLDWGRIVVARAEQDPDFAPWFCPPRPLTAQHFAQLFDSLAEALAAARDDRPERAIAALARFHQRFVRLHPFRAANQSLAMNLVNRVLTQVRGAGMPHLLLDQLALRFSEHAYALQFECAVRAFAVSGTPVERHRALSARKARHFGFIERLARAESPEAAQALVAREPAEAALCLIPA